MQIRLTKPLAQAMYGRVIPAGVTLNAPAALAERLLRAGKAEPVRTDQTPQSAVATAESAPLEAASATAHRRGRKVTADA